MTLKPKLCLRLRQAGSPLQSGLHFLNSEERDSDIIPVETAEKLPSLAEWAGHRGNRIHISDCQRKSCRVFLYPSVFLAPHTPPSPTPKAIAVWAGGSGHDSVCIKIALKTRPEIPTNPYKSKQLFAVSASSVPVNGCT